MSPPLRPTKEDVLSAFRRSALLEAARQVFGECGFERATMERIARQAEVAKGTIYLYYSSKQSIYDEALEEGLAELESITRASMDGAATPREALAAFIGARTEYFLKRQAFFRMYVAAVAAQDRAAGGRSAALRAMVSRQARPLEDVLARAVARREIRRVDPAATALAVFDLTRGLVSRKLLLGRGGAGLANHDADTEFLTELIWHGLDRGGSARAASPARPGRRTHGVAPARAGGLTKRKR